MARNKVLPAHQAFPLLADGRAVRLGLFVVVTSRRHTIPPDTDRIAAFFTVLYPLSSVPGEPEIDAQVDLLDTLRSPLTGMHDHKMDGRRYSKTYPIARA